MNVLHVISSGGMYGAEAVILSIMEELNAAPGHRCALAVFHNPDHPKPTVYEVAQERGFAGELVHLISCRGQFDHKVGSQLRALAAKTAAEVVHAHGYKADIYAAFAWGRDRPGLVSTCHTWYDNDIPVRVYGAIDRWVLRRFDGVVAVSEEVRARLLGSGVEDSRIRLIRNGVRMGPFREGRRERACRATANAKVRLGLVGRLAPEKGIDVFLRAAAIVKQQRPQTEFDVAGDGPDREEMLQLIRELGLESCVRLLGRCGDMPEFYASLDLLVSSSRQEGLPIALLEGMASGLPVVATQVGAVPEIIVNEENGLLVAPDQPESLAAAMLRAIDDPLLRERLGEAGQQRVQRDFSAARMASDYLRFYEQALYSKSAAGARSLQRT